MLVEFAELQSHIECLILHPYNMYLHHGFVSKNFENLGGQSWSPFNIIETGQRSLVHVKHSFYLLDL